MGTRGFITFVAPDLREPAGEVEKTTYNHFDSYPEGLGLAVLTWLRDEVCPDNPTNRTRLVRAVTDLRVVREDVDEVTAVDVKRLAPWTDVGVGGPVPSDKLAFWYQVLRLTQGDPAAIIQAGVIEDAREFPRDSLFAEWGYVVDARRDVLEVYEGFQQAPHDVGRFADRTPIFEDPDFGSRTSEYYPVKRIAEWSSDALPTDEVFVRECHARSRWSNEEESA